MNINEQEQFKRNEKLVSREVYACVTPLVSYILEAQNADARTPLPSPPFSWDDVENLYAEPSCDCEDKAECDCEAEPQEVYEWWAVSSWLFEQLKARGEPVIDTFPLLWGRTTTGQAIALDSVISDIQREFKYAQGDEQ